METDETTASIAESYGINRETVTATAKRHGWPMRRDRPPRGSPAAECDMAPAEGAGDAALAAEVAALDAQAEADNDVLPLALRLEQAVVRELARVEQRHRAGGNMRPSESERVARTLSTLTQTLFKVRELRACDAEGGARDEPDDMPADIDRFRDALAHRIEAFVASRSGAEAMASGEAGATEHPADQGAGS